MAIPDDQGNGARYLAVLNFKLDGIIDSLKAFLNETCTARIAWFRKLRQCNVACKDQQARYESHLFHGALQKKIEKWDGKLNLLNLQSRLWTPLRLAALWAPTVPA
jgi:hypothetical protein